MKYAIAEGLRMFGVLLIGTGFVIVVAWSTKAAFPYIQSAYNWCFDHYTYGLLPLAVVSVIAGFSTFSLGEKISPYKAKKLRDL